MAKRRGKDADAGKPMLTRPPVPEPHPTPDGVSVGMRRVGGYAWRLVAIGAVVWGVFTFVTPIQPLMLALFFAALIGAWLMPLVNRLARVMPRWLGAVISLLLFLAVIALVIVFIGSSAVSQWSGIGAAFQEGLRSLDMWLREGPLALTDADLVSVYQRVQSFVLQQGGSIALGVLSGLGSFLGTATALAAGLFVLLFLLMQPHTMFEWFVRWMPERHREVIGTSVKIGWTSFSQYSRGVLLVAISNAVLVTVLLMIMRVPMAIPLGVIVFFGAFIPYIGAPIAMFLAAFVALVSNGPLAGALVIVLIFVIGQLEGNVLQPVIMGEAVNLHPVGIVLVTAVGTAYLGLIGALIGVPVAAAVYGIAKYLRGSDRASAAPADIP